MGNKLLYCLMNPKYIEKVINSTKALDKDCFYEPFAQMTGEGLVTLGGAKWKRHRKVITPSFNQRVLDSFVVLFNEKGVDLVKKLEKHVGQRNVPVYSILGKMILELACQTSMGVELDVESLERRLDEVLDKQIHLFTEKTLILWNHFEVIWYLSGKKKMYQDYINRFGSIISEVIKKKIKDEKPNEQKKLGILNNYGDIPEKHAFLDTLIENTDLDENEIRDEVNTFILAATETTTNALAAILTMLGIYRDVQEEVYKEIIDVVGVEGEVMPQDLIRMELTERVIKETLRLFPAGPVMSRYVSGDIDIGDNIIIPEGVSVAVPLLYIHRNGEIYEDPLKFDPDRFLPENVAKRPPSTYFGFSQGPRSCIGSKYAMMNMKVILAHAIRRLKFFSEYKSVADIELKMTMLLRMKHGPKVWVEKR
ncbi:unnamed protein product [Acanthoscelides obtectus]|nr:unnamed protein product [Acanthoscelides obtectus]CAK1666492.1 Cytochrome P450 4C1 [Acanthoscelides obtectus]